VAADGCLRGDAACRTGRPASIPTRIIGSTA